MQHQQQTVTANGTTGATTETSNTPPQNGSVTAQDQISNENLQPSSANLPSGQVKTDYKNEYNTMKSTEYSASTAIDPNLSYQPQTTPQQHQNNQIVMNSNGLNSTTALNSGNLNTNSMNNYYTNGGGGGYSAGSLAVDPSVVQNPSTLQDTNHKPNENINSKSGGFNYSIGAILDGNGVPMNNYSLTSLSNVGSAENNKNNNDLNIQNNDPTQQLQYSSQLTSMAGNGITSLNTTSLNGTGTNLNGTSLNGYSQTNTNSQTIPPVTSYYYQTNNSLPASSTLQSTQNLTGSSSSQNLISQNSIGQNYYSTGTSSPSQQTHGLNQAYPTNSYYAYNNGQILDSTNYYSNTQTGVIDEVYMNPTNNYLQAQQYHLPGSDHTTSHTTNLTQISQSNTRKSSDSIVR